MKIKNFTFTRGASGGLDIVVRQVAAENSPVIASLHTSEEDLYTLLASLELSADEDEEELSIDDKDFVIGDEE
jgi:hypothetical protein